MTAGLVILVLELLVASPATVHATDWSGCFDGTEDAYGAKIVGTSDGGAIVAGRTGSSSALVARVDSGGALLWSLRRDAGIEELWDIALLPGDECLVVGYVRLQPGNNQAWAMRLDASGSIVWELVFGGSGSDEVRNVTSHDDGRSLVAGHRSVTPFVAGLDSSGRLDWQVAIDCEGGPFQDAKPTSDGGFVLVSSLRPIADPRSDGLIVKFDAARRLEWQRLIGDASDSGFRQVVELSDGSLVAVGYYSTSSGPRGPWLVKFDDTGEVLWNVYVPMSALAAVHDVLLEPDGTLVLGGSIDSRDLSRVWRLDANGNLLDIVDHALAGQWCRGIAVAPDGYMLTGSMSREASADAELWVMRLDSNARAPSACWSLAPTGSVVPLTMSATDPGFAIVDPGMTEQPPVTFTDTRDILVARPTCPPPEVQGLVATRSGDDVALAWEPIPADVDSYEAYRGSLPAVAPLAYDHLDIGACAIASTTWTDAGAALDGLDWYYLVVARNWAGRGPYGFDSLGAAIPAAGAECP